MRRRFRALCSIDELQTWHQARQREHKAALARRLAETVSVPAQPVPETFRQAMRDVIPMAPGNRRNPEPPALIPIARQRQIDEQAALAESLSDEIDISQYLDHDDSLSYRIPAIGPEIPRRLRRGDWAVVAQLDLHGLRVDEARNALVEFLAQCHKHEYRCIRIIHGKGLGSANREPVLRAKVMRWLVQRSDVLAFCRARPNDGGAGALIVLLADR